VIRLIAENPWRAARIWRDARRMIPRRFPYAVLYVARDDGVYIIAVLHQRRDPRLAVTRAARFQA
jgi:plasmid stabilization system protein ParE